MSDNRKLRWRPWRYSLRSLLVLTALTGIVCACWVVPVERQKSAVAAIREAGGHVSYNTGEADLAHPAPQWVVDLLGIDYVEQPKWAFVAMDGTRSALPNIGRLESLQAVNVIGASVGDQDLTPLGELPHLRFLNLGGTRAGDEGLPWLENKERLERLELHGTATDDRAMRRIARLSHLTRLNLSRTHLTDAGLAHVQQLRNLQELHLNRTHVTDAGLMHLHTMQSLEFVSVNGSKVTKAGADELRRALPRCVVNETR